MEEELYGEIKQDISAIWLRWNCACEQCLQPSSGQKILNPLDWPEEIILKSCTVENNKLKFTIYGEEDHIGEIPLDLLRRGLTSKPQGISDGPRLGPRVTVFYVHTK